MHQEPCYYTIDIPTDLTILTRSKMVSGLDFVKLGSEMLYFFLADKISIALFYCDTLSNFNLLFILN